MIKDKVKLECPLCYWMFDAERPNSFHPVASLSKPKKNSVDGADTRRAIPLYFSFSK